MWEVIKVTSSNALIIRNIPVSIPVTGKVFLLKKFKRDNRAKVSSSDIMNIFKCSYLGRTSQHAGLAHTPKFFLKRSLKA